jgi:hypothetical protein
MTRLAAMSGPARKSLLACVLALALAGCGGDGEAGEGALSEEQAALLEDTLTEVEREFAGGRCEDARAEADQLVASVDALPLEVGPEVKEPLREMAKNLETLTAEQCAETDVAEETTTPTTTSVPSTTVAPTTTATKTEKETTTDPAEEEEEPVEPEEPEEEPPTVDPGPDQVPPGQEPGGSPGQGGGVGTGGFSEDPKR